MSRAPAPPRDRREAGEIFSPGFALFADMLLVGLLTSLACLPVVTVPAAFSAASATLRETVGTGTQIRIGAYVGHLRAHLCAGSLAAGLAVPLLAVVLLVDSALVRGALPGAAVMAPALVLLTLGCVTVGLRSTALTAPYRLSAREGLLRSAADPRGTLLLGSAVLLAALLAWSMPLLTPLLPGPVALAATAVDLRTTTPQRQS
ncbi:hypothetical protein [Streptomyces sp. NPDC004629]|uniref:hypothetical protein n=1 Tax=Streptomyces sp. NPDC004629 TaxID=3364705 RepID=UPI00368C0BCB